MSYKCILAMIKPDLTDKVVSAAKEVGATGATIISASGTGKKEAKTFFGLNLDIRTEIVLFLVQESIVESVLQAIHKAGRFHEPGTGIALTFCVEKAIGMESQLRKNDQNEADSTDDA